MSTAKLDLEMIVYCKITHLFVATVPGTLSMGREVKGLWWDPTVQLYKNTDHMFSYPFTEIDECYSSPCHNQGTCMDNANGYKCTCHGGYTGEHCETGRCFSSHIEWIFQSKLLFLIFSVCDEETQWFWKCLNNFDKDNWYINPVWTW